MIAISIITSLLSIFGLSQSARILGVVPFPSFSHQIVFRPIWHELAKRGHDVVVITTDPENNPDANITEIDISFAYDVYSEKQIIKKAAEYRHNIFKIYDFFIKAFTDILKEELLHPDIQRLLKNESEYFDLVIVEYLLPPMFAISARFKCPYVGVVTLELPDHFHGLLGNPVHPIAYPNAMELGLIGKLNFWERLAAVGYLCVTSLMQYLSGGINDNQVVRELLEEHFGKDIPPLLDISKNVSMVFINDNPAFNVRPMGPSFVLFGGGSHMKPPKPLPKDLKEYLDSAKEGFIYFSLGTNIKSDIFTPELRKVVLDAFRELPYKVLWKFDVLEIPDLPANVKISTWLPQQDVLRHPNIKVFLSQGGLQSSEEAILSHVPIIGIPFISDQLGNIKKLEAKGCGVLLNKDSLTKESLKEALLEVINNPKYKESITDLAEFSRDQPMTGLEKTVWWTEYVIRHKGARHFRNPAIDLPLYQYYMLDVIGFVLGVLFIFLFVNYKLIVFIKNFILKWFRSWSNKIKTQ